MEINISPEIFDAWLRYLFIVWPKRFWRFSIRPIIDLFAKYHRFLISLQDCDHHGLHFVSYKFKFNEDELITLGKVWNERYDCPLRRDMAFLSECHRLVFASSRFRFRSWRWEIRNIEIYIKNYLRGRLGK